MHSTNDLYQALAISPNAVTSAQIEALATWVRAHVSTDYVNEGHDLPSQFSGFHALLSAYFDKNDLATTDRHFLQFAIDSGWDSCLNDKNPSGEQINALANAWRSSVVKGHFHTLQYLFSRGLVPPTSQSSILHETLMLPCLYAPILKQKKEQIVEFLVARWPELLSVVQQDGSTVFHTMAENNFDALLSRYAASHEQLATTMNHQGHYPVDCAILNGGYESAAVLLAMKGGARQPDTRGRFPIHYAAQYGDERMMRLCLSVDRSSLNVRDNEGKTPLQLADDADNLDAARLLRAIGAEGSRVEPFVRNAAP